MAVSDSIGLLFKIKADSDQARAEMDKLRKAFDTDIKSIEQGGKGAFLRLGEAAGLSTGQMAGLAKALPLVAGGIAVVAGAAVAAATALFALTKSASDYGTAIFEAAQKTGLSTEAISALKFAADQSGGSMEQLTAGIKIFSKTVGDAANGSKEAADKLKRLGIDPQEAIKDLEAALAKAFKTIHNAPEGILRTNAALDAFGRSGAELIPTIESFDGDLNKLMVTVGDLGGLMSAESAKMADDFGDAFDKITAQMKFAGFVAAQELMPQMTQAMGEISKYVSENRDTFRQWGEGVGQIISGIRAIAESEIGQMIGMFLKLSVAMSLPLRALGLMHQQSNSNPEMAPVHIADADANVPSVPPGFRNWARPGGGGGGSRGGGGGGRGKAAGQTDEERALKLLDQLTAARAKHGGQTERERINLLLLTDAYNGLSPATRRAIDETLRASEADDAAKKSKEKLAKAAEMYVAFIKKQRTEMDELRGVTHTAVDEVDDFVESLQKMGVALAPGQIELMKLTAIAISGAEAIERMKTAIDNMGTIPGPEGGLFGTQLDPNNPIPAGELDIPPPQNIDVWKNSLKELKAIGMDALGALAQGIGNMVHEWVLMGSVAPGAMKKLVASTLAGVAAQCAVLGVMELAYAAAGFTPWGLIQFGSPIQHLKSAAFFFAAAAAAGIAGRVVAGNSFQNAGAAGGAGASGGAGNVGGAPAARETNIIDLERNRPQPIEVVVRMQIASNDSHIVEAVESNVRNNGNLRNLMVQMVEA